MTSKFCTASKLLIKIFTVLCILIYVDHKNKQIDDYYLPFTFVSFVCPDDWFKEILRLNDSSLKGNFYRLKPFSKTRANSYTITTYRLTIKVRNSKIKINNKIFANILITFLKKNYRWFNDKVWKITRFS